MKHLSVLTLESALIYEELLRIRYLFLIIMNISQEFGMKLPLIDAGMI
jgi:hypothetical protein